MQVDTIDKIDSDHYGLFFFEAGDKQYAAGIDEEVQKAVKECIEESLWTFRAEFIVENSHVIPYECTEMVRLYQETKCDDANDAIRSLIEDIDEFVAKAVAADGRGQFLAYYDGNERQLSDLDPVLWGQVLGALKLKSKDLDKVFVYRIN